MEQLPLQGRNWMELSKMVKGITANDVGNSIGTGVDIDDMWQLNLDGQQITQKIAGSGFGQPQVQPRVDRRVPDRDQHVRHHAGALGRHRDPGDLEIRHQHQQRQRLRLLPQRLRSTRPTLVAQEACCRTRTSRSARTLGGPIVKDKLHYFASYEYEREPGTILSNPSQLPGQTLHAFRTRSGSRASSRRVDDQLSLNNRLSLRGSRWDWENPFMLGGRPASVAGLDPDQGRDATCSAPGRGSWAAAARVQEMKGGYNGFHWTNAPQPR